MNERITSPGFSSRVAWVMALPTKLLFNSAEKRDGIFVDGESESDK